MWCYPFIKKYNEKNSVHVCKPIMIEGDRICLFEDIFFQLAQAIPDID